MRNTVSFGGSTFSLIWPARGGTISREKRQAEPRQGNYRLLEFSCAFHVKSQYFAMVMIIVAERELEVPIQSDLGAAASDVVKQSQ